MKKFNFRIKAKLFVFTSLAGALMTVSSCFKEDNIFDLDINTDPNNPTKAAVNLLLPEVQRNYVAFLQGLNDNQMGFMGVLSSFDSYGIQQNDFNGSWNFFFSGPGKDLDEMIKAAKAQGNLPYLGVGQVLKAYAFSTMVDLWGTVPFTEAFGGNSATANIAPKYDDGKTVYEACYKLLDSGITNLKATSTIAISGDIMYGGSKPAWIKFANTIRLRMLMTSRKVNANASADIQAALNATGGIITSPSEDFTWKYGGQIVPELRHPWFTAAYLDNNNFTYILTQYMFDMLVRKDPRLPFYFRRQYDKILDQNDPTDRGATPVAPGYLVIDNASWNKAVAAGVLSRNATDSAYLAGFFGRVRGDQSGVPEDVRYRMVPGVYPAAGLYDDRTKAPYVLNTKANAGGAGILPLVTSNIVRFWRAEAELAYGFGDPRKTAADAIRESISNVVSFGLAKDPNNAKAPTAAAIDAYVNAFLAEYDAAPTNQGKLSKVLYEAWFAGWGNGFEMYNAFRRTGFPSNIIPPVTLLSQFALRLPIPAFEADLNPNAPNPLPISDKDAIFWDDIKFKF